MSLPLIAAGAVLERIAMPVLAALLAAALAVAGWQYLRAERAETTLAQERAHVERQVAAAVTQARSEEQRRTLKIMEAKDAEFIARQKDQADARRAVAAGVGLQHQLAAIRSAYTSSHTEAAAERASAGQAIAVLTELLDRCSERRRELARFADDAYRAGKTCERSFDALTPSAGEGG